MNTTPARQQACLLSCALVLTTSVITGMSLAAEAPEKEVNLGVWNGRFVVAEKGGGGAVKASSIRAREWETFTLIDLNGEPLRHKDEVQLRTYDNRHYIAAGASIVRANRTSPEKWGTFSVERVHGSGQVFSGDSVRFRTWNKRYLTAVDGGGGVVKAGPEDLTSTIFVFKEVE